jgi:hypothetical protein
MKLLKLTLSGTYGKREDAKDYEVEGTIPFVDEDRAHQAAVRRYAAMWISKKYGERPKKVREVYMDDCKEVEGTLSLIGKNVKEISYEEVQDLAVLKNLKLPGYKSGGLRVNREAAIKEYLLNVKKVPADKVNKIMQMKFADLPDLIIEHDEYVAEEVVSEAVSLNKELAEFGVQVKEEEVKNEEYSLQELKDLATAKGIKFHPNIGFDTLKKKVFVE